MKKRGNARLRGSQRVSCIDERCIAKRGGALQQETKKEEDEEIRRGGRGEGEGEKKSRTLNRPLVLGLRVKR